MSVIFLLILLVLACSLRGACAILFFLQIVATHLEKQAEEARVLLAQEEAEKANRRRARAAAGEGEEVNESKEGRRGVGITCA